jgi:hypothetical protein
MNIDHDRETKFTLLKKRDNGVVSRPLSAVQKNFFAYAGGHR